MNPPRPLFRLGTTSYILPDDILPNVCFLADKVRDIELVLFEIDDGPNNIPSLGTIAALSALARQHDLSYTVHLPLDLRLGESDDESHPSLIKARKVIERTRALNPWAYVLHLDGRDLKLKRTPQHYLHWQEQCIKSLEIVSGWAGAIERLAVENLEGYSPDFLHPVLERIEVSQCFDVGHLWLDGIDPLPLLKAALPRTRVIHIHGLADRDHKSLIHVPPEKLDPIVDTLLREKYAGVLTLEIFSKEDFHSSKMALFEAMRRVCQNA